MTDGLLAKFGEQRVIDTPLAGGHRGDGLGMAIYGLKPVPESSSGLLVQAFHDRTTPRYRARTRGRYHIQMVVRMPYGAACVRFEHHSEARRPTRARRG